MSFGSCVVCGSSSMLGNCPTSGLLPQLQDCHACSILPTLGYFHMLLVIKFRMLRQVFRSYSYPITLCSFSLHFSPPSICSWPTPLLSLFPLSLFSSQALNSMLYYKKDSGFLSCPVCTTNPLSLSSKTQTNSNLAGD